jgi:serine protease Do
MSLPIFKQSKSIFLATLLLAAASGARAVEPAEEPIVQAVQRTLPAVVNIYTEHVVEGVVSQPYNLFFRRYYLGHETVHSLGSGLLVSPEGYIVTNHHVVQMADPEKIRVTLSNGSLYQARLLSSDPDKDLALLKVEDKNPFPYMDMQTTSPNLLGETVIALGNPVGFQNSVSHGILSAKNRTFSAEGVTMEGLLQTDAAINPGNSGGPLVDINGNLAGINSAKFTGTAVEGIGFAIPAEIVVPWVSDAIAVAKGLKAAPRPVSLFEVLRQRFGFTLQNLTSELAANYGLRITDGLLITQVEPGSPAENQNLRPGMVIVGIGQYGVYNEETLPRDILRIKPGEPVLFTVVALLQKGGTVLQRGAKITLQAR